MGRWVSEQRPLAHADTADLHRVGLDHSVCRHHDLRRSPADIEHEIPPLGSIETDCGASEREPTLLDPAQDLGLDTADRSGRLKELGSIARISGC